MRSQVQQNSQSSFSAEQVAWHLACRKQDSTTLLCMSGIKIPVIILGRTFRLDTKALNRGMSIKRMFVRFAMMGYLEKSIWYLPAVLYGRKGSSL